eukprot:m.12944 g.12944  ORF g.12944 m.12944 type:complete len:1035 (+) comp4758_c0_seq1:48-3152(+)
MSSKKQKSKKQESISRFFAPVAKKAKISDKPVTKETPIQSGTKTIEKDLGDQGNTGSPEDSPAPSRKRIRRTLTVESDESDDDEYKPPVKKGIKVSSPVESSSSKKKKQVGSKQKHAKPASKSPKKPQSNNVGSPSKLQPKDFGSLLEGSGKKVKYTPLESQFIEIKKQYADAILAVEVGYKYRFFGHDAEIAAPILNIACFPAHAFMSASIPTHRLYVHVRKLVEAGYKVGVVRQVDTAALKKVSDEKSGPFKRELKQLYTKSTMIDEGLDDDEVKAEGFAVSNFLLILKDEVSEQDEELAAISMVAVSLGTGKLYVDSFQDDYDRTKLKTRIEHLQPSEILIPEQLTKRSDSVVAFAAASGNNPPRLEKIKCETFTITEDVSESFDSSFQQLPAQVQGCLHALVIYLKDFGLDKVVKLASKAQSFSDMESYMRLSAYALRNLEIFQNQTNRSVKGSLYWVMNHTVTPFGARLLRSWLSRPLRDDAAIKKRLDTVQAIVDGGESVMTPIQDMMKKLPDLERQLTNSFFGKCSPSLFYSMLVALETVRDCLVGQCEIVKKELVDTLIASNVVGICEALEDVKGILSCLNEKSAMSNDKINLLEGEAQVHEIVDMQKEIKSIELRLQDHLKEVSRKIGMPGMKYTTVSGETYLLEIKKKQLGSIPSDWDKISATKDKDRYRTQYATEQLELIAQIKEKMDVVASQSWHAFLEKFTGHFDRYQQVVSKLSELDCLLSLGSVSSQPGFVRPTINPKSAPAEIKIEDGRNPIVDSLLDGAQFVPNDVDLCNDAGRERCYIVTGPNMGGKSCYIRQVALISVLAQVGSYVPATSATITPLDAVYIRMGAEDNIFEKSSTFMHELREASHIIANATEKSLVIMDELGRGTSTHDGVAIAHASCAYLAQNIKCLSLFVTHYPSVANLAVECKEVDQSPIIGNFHMSFVEEKAASDTEDGTQITFLYKLVRGAAARSYGLNVARLANIPNDVLMRAKQKSQEIESVVQNRQTSQYKSLLLKIAQGDAAGSLSMLNALVDKLL